MSEVLHTFRVSSVNPDKPCFLYNLPLFLLFCDICLLRAQFKVNTHLRYVMWVQYFVYVCTLGHTPDGKCSHKRDLELFVGSIMNKTNRSV